MFLDLTHTIAPGMPMYPGSPAPALAPLGDFARQGYRETVLTLSSHTGTHMDAPAHMLRGGGTLDALAVERFCGRAVCLDVSRLAGGAIPAEYLRARDGALRGADFVLFYTGWETRWGTDAYLEDGFPVPDRAAAEYLVSLGLKGVGTDAVSIDPLAGGGYPAHRTLLAGGLVILEALRLKDLAGRSGFRLLALPMKFENADGAPVRAVAELLEPPAEKELDKA